ncbi:pro-opiomelanocortin [Sigmodon hispidus]
MDVRRCALLRVCANASLRFPGTSALSSAPTGKPPHPRSVAQDSPVALQKRCQEGHVQRSPTQPCKYKRRRRAAGTKRTTKREKEVKEQRPREATKHLGSLRTSFLRQHHEHLPTSEPRSCPQKALDYTKLQPVTWKMPRSCYSRAGALLLALLLQTSMEVWGWCLESRQCQDLTTESNLLACILACKPDLSAETPVFPGNGDEQPLTENPRKYVMGHFRWDRFGPRNSSIGAQRRAEEEEEDAAAMDDGRFEPALREGKRSYSMEHFRWGKPVGKKRRPVKVYPNVAEDESAEAFPLEFKRELAGEQPDGLEHVLEPDADKEDGPYRMERFRWGSPPKDKRYGGFMTSEKSHTPLVTLFKNAIIKNAHKKGQ